MCLRRKKKGKSKFSFTDFVYLTQELRSNCLHLSNKYARIVMPSARLLNHVKKNPRDRSLDLPFFFRLSTYFLLIRSLRQCNIPRLGKARA